MFEDPFVLVIQNEAYSVDDDLVFLNILYVTHIGNFTWLKPHNVDKIAQVNTNPLM